LTATVDVSRQRPQTAIFGSLKIYSSPIFPARQIACIVNRFAGSESRLAQLTELDHLPAGILERPASALHHALDGPTLIHLQDKKTATPVCYCIAAWQYTGSKTPPAST
jgi:hypothetical protein